MFRKVHEKERELSRLEKRENIQLDLLKKLTAVLRIPALSI